MAAQTCIHTKHATLSTTTADTIKFSGAGSTLAITNRDATNTLYFRFDGVTAVAAADETFVVMPSQTKTVQVRGTPPLVSVVANGGGYSAELF
jgi:hypothetical protein